MRLWSLHPRYLDARGLVALWREALLARAVLRGETRGYREHPQLTRFREHPAPLDAIEAYLAAVLAEAAARGYSFDAGKVRSVPAVRQIPVTAGQVACEWRHLLAKLARRAPSVHERWARLAVPECHPLFTVRDGGAEGWERVRDEARGGMMERRRAPSSEED